MGVGVVINVKIADGEVKAILTGLRSRVQTLTPAMKVIGDIVRSSVVKNFMEGGRPKWQPSKRARAEGGQTLRDTGRLYKSITSKAYPDRAEVGTNVKYAARHQFGFTGTEAVRQYIRKVKTRDVYEKIGRKKRIIAKGIGVVRAHSRKAHTPARPYLMVQDEDWPEIKRALEDYLRRGY